jgi:hypothetical protein
MTTRKLHGSTVDPFTQGLHWHPGQTTNPKDLRLTKKLISPTRLILTRLKQMRRTQPCVLTMSLSLRQHICP